MINAATVYIKIAWAYKTPLILLLDSKYDILPTLLIKTYLEKMPDLSYIPELRDCDNFAFIFKGVADRQTNAIGIVIGKVPGGLHCWNIALCRNGIWQVEPQNGRVFKHDKHYKPLAVII